jgi:hypothetical protein
MIVAFSAAPKVPGSIPTPLDGFVCLDVLEIELRGVLQYAYLQPPIDPPIS